MTTEQLEHELVPSYSDGHLSPDHPLWASAESAYRKGYVSGAMQASQWLRPDRVDLDVAREQRECVRDNHSVEQNGVYLYIAGHEVHAAYTRGRHHAMAFVEQMWDRPDIDNYDVFAELERWVENVEAWAASPLDPEHQTCPPQPDDDWPPPPEEKPVPPAPPAPPRPPAGNLTFLWDGSRPVSPTPSAPEESFTFPMQSLRELVMCYPQLRPPVIHGLLREGETLNVIASPKTGKSWLVSDLALSVATGRPWLDLFPCEQGRVLLIDNELHKETSASRIPKVMEVRGITLSDCGDRIDVANLRGELKDIFGLGQCFARIEPGQFKLVVLDAFYRFMPKDSDENSNATMAQVYNVIDAYAAKLQCAFVLIHHSTKGNQSGKSVTDVGAGAGAQSRAADTHLILRPHEQQDVAVLDAAVRSWPPIQPRCLRWTFPVWSLADELDPADLKAEKPRRKPKPVEPDKPAQPEWDAESFAASFVKTEPATKLAIEQAALKVIPSERRVEKLLKLAEQQGLIHRWKFAATQPVQFAIRPQPSNDGKEVAG